MGELAGNFDVVIVGSGFGGSVAALRLTEKGYRVAVLEAGRRFADDEFAKTSWNLRKYLWAPQFKCFGIQRIHTLRNVMVLAGAGVGGGSLVYANTLYRPLKPFYEDRQWAHITDWQDELDPFYDQASRMLGVVTNPTTTPSDVVMQKVAKDMGVEDSYHATPVGVFFGEPGKKAADPYFGGAGPERTGCTECGSCMSGCRVGAKNTLVKNYLYLAEKLGAQVFPLTTVTQLKEDNGTWTVHTKMTGGRATRTFTADQVVVAAGTWGTQQLLHQAKASTLPKISPKLGELTRTNSESIIGAARYTVDPDTDYTQGVAITSSIHPDEITHIEPVRYGKGSNAMGMLQTLATDGALSTPRWLQFVKQAFRHPLRLLRLLSVHRWSERTVILLVMQSLDNSITTFLKRGKLTSKQGHGEPNPAFIPAGHEANLLAAKHIDGMAGGTWGELFNIPLTAHFIGGCAIASGEEQGVIDPYHRVFNYPGLSVVDGSAISANLGVNPSLTITAQAERAFSLWPNKGEQDQRPAQDQPYRRINPTKPKNPAVPDQAPAALRLPIVKAS
ncbi:FAD-dependent oxidoreductase [Lentzea flaviverrucosa]|uniref:Cholesterol oxidase n=1 Tax=Lentzea flaviverrucosa TaxID=200379 RepID=A0A1H9TII1_9PSEU|nr:GMC family oxidoreductase [Lentzea flaviverrucosa]RDI33590.1 cholesterol oxidase [Lentzea flaviverrucosa]SER97150.1 cholesterol oxidase [Lentzea flaviverrucosa]